MVGKPGTAPGLPVPKTGGLLLSHIPMKYLNEAFLACLEGLEPSAFRLGGGCSILLSYRRIQFISSSQAPSASQKRNALPSQVRPEALLQPLRLRNEICFPSIPCSVVNELVELSCSTHKERVSKALLNVKLIFKKSFWQAEQDLNPHQRFWRPLFCR